MGKDKNRAGASGKSKAKSRAPTTSTEERLYYGDGSYLWFDSKEERTRFLTFFSKRVVAPPWIILERYPELQGYDDLDAQLHQAGLWTFVSRARKEINPALIRVFYSNLRRDDVSLYGGEDWVLNNEGLILNKLGITELIRHASGRPTIHSANPDGRLLLYIVSRIIKPRKHGHTIMSGEDLKLIHAIKHSAPINWAKFVMINMTITASTDHDHLLPYPFVVMDILERFKVTTTVGPLTKATKIWAVSTQTFKKRSNNAGPATAVQRRRSAAGPAEAQARANLASIADSLNRLHFKVGGMDGYLERLDEAVQRQGHAMNAYFQRVNYVPSPPTVPWHVLWASVRNFWNSDVGFPTALSNLSQRYCTLAESFWTAMLTQKQRCQAKLPSSKADLNSDVLAQFFELREEARQNGLKVTDEEIWYSLVEGHNAKNRVPGVGDYAREMKKINPSSKPRRSSTSSSSTAEMAALKEQNQRLQEQLDNLTSNLSLTIQKEIRKLYGGQAPVTSPPPPSAAASVRSERASRPRHFPIPVNLV
ncbi:unnamed protein product [Cuscuta campestris]|uniref:Uncharacterized protein n=1 Tax=Cuscuta campestris TaxID=132261 RepID=A0A484KXX9_9ASTE|nr:unnamed protein product [Cuscuta campestris]